MIGAEIKKKGLRMSEAPFSYLPGYSLSFWLVF